MNDKCAAGTGRFLEMIARTLEVSLDELGAIALTSKEKIEITSMCSVFAESEVISLIANNKEKADIADGVCHAIANKASGLLRRVGMEPEFMMTGGVAKNPGVVRAVEEKIGSKLYICEEPEIVGAAGAAIYALEKRASEPVSMRRSNSKHISQTFFYKYRAVVGKVYRAGEIRRLYNDGKIDQSSVQTLGYLFCISACEVIPEQRGTFA